MPSGLAHVATASFLASRISPTAGFWIALAGASRWRASGSSAGRGSGYGASIAAMLQTVAIMGPVSFGVPLTQALTAPCWDASKHAADRLTAQILACAAIRLAQNAVFVAFVVLVLAGGIDAYTDTYDSIASWMPLLPEGTEAALIVTGVSLLVWAAFASTVQVLVYHRGLHRWPREPSHAPRDADAGGAARQPPALRPARDRPRGGDRVRTALGRARRGCCWPPSRPGLLSPG